MGKDDTVAPLPPLAKRPLLLPLRERSGPDPAHGVAGLGEVQVQHGLRERPAQLHQVGELPIEMFSFAGWVSLLEKRTMKDGAL